MGWWLHSSSSQTWGEVVGTKGWAQAARWWEGSIPGGLGAQLCLQGLGSVGYKEVGSTRIVLGRVNTEKGLSKSCRLGLIGKIMSINLRWARCTPPREANFTPLCLAFPICKRGDCSSNN